ncbi:MAG: glycosyl hydrolase [Kiritimatiellae bacterium]|nr:glycosyl hydrolase [Kiritimatiellia bacterium]
MNTTLKNTFANPPSLYRAKPFWAWNGKLEEGELRRQIRSMRQMGLGGFFMHSRVGLATPYLSPEWFNLVNACIDEARKQKMEAWLYDEDRWPSGAAGGLVTKNPRYRMRRLVMETVASGRAIPGDWDVVAVFTARVQGLSARDVVCLDSRRSLRTPSRGHALFVFRVTTAALSSWYNGYTYLDTLSREAVREFIRVTHEAYKRHCRQYFGRLVPGIFSDEPHFGGKFSPISREGGLSIPWTPALPAVFRKRYGYNLMPHLLELFFDVDGREMTPARYHYHECLSFLFADAFARQIGEWCARQGIQFTGHVVEEDTPSHQANYVGECMRFYEHMQAPGMDLLTEHWRLYAVAKQVSSVARQFGRTWRLTETYGCTGWDFPLEGHKALGDWQLALGINLRCPHLAWYTMAGEAKRDFPASISYQSPWWDAYAKVEDYFARVNAVMTQGTEVRDLLVIHPVESVWVMFRKDGIKHPDIQAFDKMFATMTQDLLARQLDFDYGSEAILARHARVAIKGGRAEFVVGRARYRAVLVPPMKTMRATTLDWLRRFRSVGGQVIFAGKPAVYVAGAPSDAPAHLAADCVHTQGLTGDAVRRHLDPLCRRVALYDAERRPLGSVLYLLREDRRAFYLFICNTGHTSGQRRNADVFKDVMVRDRPTAYPRAFIAGFAECAGAPQEWDAETGVMYTATARRLDNGAWEIATSLERLGSRLFVIPKKKDTRRFPARHVMRVCAVRRMCPVSWNIVLSEPNVLVLDRPRYRIGNGTWQPETEILRVDRAVRSALGIPLRGGSMVQPWAQKPDRAHKTVPIELVYTVHINTMPAGVMELALEHPELFRISLNGRSLDARQARNWWTDRSMLKVPFDAALLHPGDNELSLLCDYNAKSGLEICYVLGNFGVKVKGAQASITPSVRSLKIGDWVKQGLAFYSGNVTYQADINACGRAGERVFIRLPAFRGAGARIFVNDQPAGVLAWPPYEMDITAFVKSARQERRAPRAIKLGVEILGHRRNSHGPLHYSQKWPAWTGPAEFIATGDKWREDYQLIPCGLLKPPELVIKTAGKE